jgi:hypothetical protein
MMYFIPCYALSLLAQKLAQSPDEDRVVIIDAGAGATRVTAV